MKYALVQASNHDVDVKRQFSESHPFPLRYNSIDENYLSPLNSTIGSKVVERAARLNADALYETFRRLSDALAPYVNRRAIIAGTPEARLAARLFDWDVIVKPLLGEDGKGLYEYAQKKREWNSRFWEQKALMMESDDVVVAAQFARQAVSLDHHSFPLTTLGKILFRAMDSNHYKADQHFAEAWNAIQQAINIELARSRPTIHPYMTLITGVTRFLAIGGRLSPTQAQTLRTFVNDASYRFRKDLQFKGAVERLYAVVDLG